MNSYNPNQLAQSINDALYQIRHGLPVILSKTEDAADEGNQKELPPKALRPDVMDVLVTLADEFSGKLDKVSTPVEITVFALDMASWADDVRRATDAARDYGWRLVSAANPEKPIKAALELSERAAKLSRYARQIEKAAIDLYEPWPDDGKDRTITFKLHVNKLNPTLSYEAELELDDFTEIEWRLETWDPRFFFEVETIDIYRKFRDGTLLKVDRWHVRVENEFTVGPMRVRFTPGPSKN